MALFTSYAPPGVSTTEIFVSNTASNVGTARIPVIIGEGVQFFTINNQELFRGSSPVQDDQSVNENISDQVTGFTQNFQTTFYPVVDGTGKGVVTNNPALIQCQAIYSNGNVVPVTVITLNGATGQFTTQEIIPPGTDLTITYFFKRGDTLIQNENDSYQIPQYASQTIVLGSSPNQASLKLSLTTPGESGNLVTLQFVAGPPVPDAQAVLGAGTDAITINITSTTGTRTIADLYTLVNSTSIPTLDGGYLTSGQIVLTGTATTAQPLVATAGAVPFTGGIGPNSNTVFQVQNLPIVDGTNGGVVTTNPALVTAYVNGLAVTVSAVNGSEGLVTLAQPVPYGATLTLTYYTNTWQNTFDLLPSSNVATILQVGLGPNRADYTQGVDYSLGVALDSQGNVVANTVNWGNNVSEAVGVDASGDTPFSPSEVLTTLVDESVWLRPLAGVTNGRNATFTLPDTPTDGSGQARPTNNPALVKVYIGTDPLEAFQAGAVAVSSLNGKAQSITLYNPPPAGSSVYASYYRNTLEDQQYTLTVVNPGFSGIGTYTVQDNLQRYMPLVTFNGASSYVAASGAFAATGVVYPFGFSDAVDDNGSPSETVTLTFRNDGTNTLQPAVPAMLTLTFGASTLTFAAAAGIGGNDVQIAIDVTTVNPQPVVVGGNLVTIYAFWNGTLATLSQIASYFPSAETVNGGQITCAAGGATPSTQTPTVTGATNLVGGANAVTVPVSHSYVVSSSLVTGGSNGLGYLDQTYIDAVTGFRVTIVNPSDHVAYGVTSIPQNYNFVGADDVSLNGATIQVNTDIVTVTVSNNVAVGQPVTFSGLTGATFLNGKTLNVVTATNTQLTFAMTTPNYGPTVETSGTAAAAGDKLVFNVVQNGARYVGNPGIAPAQANNQVAIFGLKTKVVSNFGATAGDTVIVSTVRGSGNEPNIGEYYYVTYTVNKVAADYAIKLYTDPNIAYAAYGQPSTINRLSLGIQFMVQNGVQTFGAIQVPVVPGTNYASSADYISAIQTLTTNLPGLNRKADVVTPLSNDPVVHQFLSRQLTTQATARYKGEAIGFVGYSQFTTPQQASANAQALLNQRMIAIGNAAAGVLLTNLTTGVSVEYLVDGTFMAAAMAGLNCNPANDVATSLTLQNLVGFSRLLITYDDNTMNLMAANGLTLLLNNNGALQIRHYKTTNPSNTLVSEPTSTTIADYVAQRFRGDLQQFIGRKLVDSLVTDIQIVCNSRLKSLQDQQIITGYENLVVMQNADDPTEVDVTVTFKPIFSLLYVSVTFTVQTSL